MASDNNKDDNVWEGPVPFGPKKVQIEEDEELRKSLGTNPSKAQLSAAHRASRTSRAARADSTGSAVEDEESPLWESNKRRRSTLLGNLITGGRLSRGYSIGHLTLHMTKEQRERKDDMFALPPDDYYLMEEHDKLGILLEKPEQLPGGLLGDLVVLKQMQAEKEAAKKAKQEAAAEEGESETEGEGEGETPKKLEEGEAPPDYVFPVQRNAVELQSKLVVTRNLRSYLETLDKRMDEGKCYYGEDEIDLTFLTAKPVTFIILGKPGIGKTTLALKLAEKMHSVHLNPENIIEYYRGPKEPLNSCRVNEKLEDGDSINDGVVIELLLKRIREFDVLHRGYVLEGFPLVTSDDQPVHQQIEILNKLTLHPKYLIIMQMQDKDLYKRRINQKFDPVTSRVYTKQQYSKFDPDEFVLYRHYPRPSNATGQGTASHMGAGTGDLSVDTADLKQGSKQPQQQERQSGATSDNPVTEEQSDTERRTAYDLLKQHGSRASTPEHGDVLVNEVDFPKLAPEVLDRLFYRTEDFNIIVNDDLESFRFNVGDLQDYVNSVDKRKVLEVDAYWAPTIIFRRVWEWCEAIGLQPTPVPVQIMRPLSMLYYKKSMGGEDAGEDDDDESDDESEDDDDDEADDEDEKKEKEDNSEEICEEDEPPPEIDWVAAMRAVCVRGLVDPRFRWRISRWQNLCPVALKLGRSIAGSPELSVSFMDKVFFMSSKHAADQFINNPRPYLLPKMPTSPIKFFVVGHPLAGKTTFARELAQLTDAVVIDMSKEVDRRFPAVKRDFLWRKRLKYALEATHIVNRENMLRWQRQERVRRRDMHAWIENHLKALAEAEIEAALEKDRELLHKLRVEMRKASEYHAMGDTFLGDGVCQSDDGKAHFNWRKFASEAFAGKRDWTHQEMLQLAWDLFHQRKLYYKRNKREKVDLRLVNDFSSSESEDGLVSPSRRRSLGSSYDSMEGEGADSGDMESELGEQSDDGESSRRKRRRKRKKEKPKKKKCVHLEVKPVKSEDIVEPFLFASFDVDPDDPEVEESVRMRFPMIPFELVDIVPSPPLVGDLDPVVQMIVEEKLTRDKIEFETMPADIFVEILKRACADVEVRYRKLNRHGAMSGGWIIDNFPPEIEKWRAVLRTPQVCPDQVFLLLDHTEGNMTIWSRFKKLYKMLHPNGPPTQQQQKEASSRGASQSNQSSGRVLPGESIGDPMGPTTQVLMEPRNSKRTVTGEDLQNDYDDADEYRRPSAGSRGGGGQADFLTTDFETEAEGQAVKEVDERSLDIVSRSHFMLSLLPKDDLTEPLSMSESEKQLIDRDLKRNMTMAFSDLDSEENFLEQAMLGHEKYVLESVNQELQESDEEGQNSWSTSVDIDEEERRKEAAARLKQVYGEMIVCIEEVDAFHHQQSQQDDEDLLGYSSQMQAAEKKMKNPPGTPETGGAGHNSDVDEDGQKRRTENDWAVPVPSEIAKGEIELSPEDNELKAELENEIKRLSMADGEEYLKTPSEMGSLATIPGTATSGEGGYSTNPLYQKLLTTRIESPKRKFFAQVRIFNEFWNMAHPVCNQQSVRYWEVGLCDEDTALEKAIFFWNELESRFDAKAKRILEMELREEDEEILESLVKFGQPYEENDIRYRANKDKGDEDDDDDEDDDADATTQDTSEDDDDEEEGEDGEGKAERDELTALENKPDLYWKALQRRQAERCFGDFKFYCPVTFADFKMLRKGTPRYACKYKDRLYYCADENSQLRFLTNPKQFITNAGPPMPPPPRICITGSPGCLQEEIAQELSTEFKVCYVNFRQRLHEILHARTEKQIGPENTMKIASKEETQRTLKDIKPGDDLLYFEGEDPGEDEFGGHVKFSFHEIPVTTALRGSMLGLINIPSQEITGFQDQQGVQNSALKSLGLIPEHRIETIPLNNFERTDKLTNRRWEKLTWVENHIKAFLENGLQLPDDVLDHFILPLWRDKPFNQVGFILVGFPNTHEDIQYMIKRNLFPEHTFVMECKSVVIRNRLIVQAVDRWHKQKNPSGKKQRKMSMRTQRAKNAMEGMLVPGGGANEVFPYQLEGRPEVDEFESETWTYNDAVARDIARALRYYHWIYSAGIEKMKKWLNRERFCWTPIDTNVGLYQGKHKVLDKLSPMLKYRSNVFEDTVRMSMAAAQSLLDRGIFTLSQLQRWCPVEVSKGNAGINLWNAPAVKKIPYLHRRFIYFVAGETNAKHFEENTWELINQVLPLPSPPLVCMVLGMPKSGKTTLARHMADRLGLLYVSCLEAVESVLTHEFATEWAHILFDLDPALASSGHQSMTLARELVEYVREGRAIPRFLVYRCLDLILMNPKAQCSGVVFDDYPTLSDELIELNYREMTPCMVLKLKVPITEAYDRCDRLRGPELAAEEVPQESRDCIDFLWDQYGNATKETLRWFAEEYQNINLVDGMLSEEMVFQKAAEICRANQKKVLHYLKNMIDEKPCTLDGTCPITSTLFHRLTPDFGFFCPVALNDNDELVSVKSITDLSQVVEYKGKIYLFSSKNAVRKFLNNPKKYTVPGCLRTPPKDMPQTLEVKPEDFERLQEHWGFMDFDPVLYYANHHFKGLQRGDPKYCVVYRNKLYVFISQENQSRFLTKPSQYWNLLLPMKLPRKSEVVNYDKLTAFSYMNAKGMVPVLRKLLKLMAEKRPRAPFMNVDQCAALYMGYYLKTLNMNSHFQVRQKYRDAMFKMSTMKRDTKEFLIELEKFYGCRPRNMPERLRKSFEEFVKYEHMPVEDKVLMPKIPGMTLGYDAVEPPFDEHQVTRKVRRMMESLRDVEIREHLDSFKNYSKKKKAAEDAAARAAQDAKDAAELADKMAQRALKRMSRMSKTKSRTGNSSSSDRQTRATNIYS